MMRFIGQGECWRNLREVHENKKNLYLIYDYIEGETLNTVI